MSEKATAYSISQLHKLTKLDRATVTKRLEGVVSVAGAKNAKLYALQDALPALIAGESSEMDEAKLRKMQADADLQELKFKREQGEVVETKEVLNYTLQLFKAVHNRIAVRFPREIAQALYKAESSAHITEVLQRDLGRIFNELRDDHKRFL
jgi:phage terminase Nu1 subunit (DNA packaging protein)